MSSFKAEKLPLSENIITFEKDRKREQAEYLGSHCFREKNKEDCLSIVTSLLSRQRNCLFLKNIITIKKR